MAKYKGKNKLGKNELNCKCYRNSEEDEWTLLILCGPLGSLQFCKLLRIVPSSSEKSYRVVLMYLIMNILKKKNPEKN